MKWTIPDRARVTYYNAEGRTIEAREHPVKDVGGYPVVDTSETLPVGAAYQRSQPVYVIDPLGAETPAQRTERKEQESLGGQLLNIFIVTVVLFVAAVALMASGIYIGATKPEVWNYVPGVPSPSGERAEPEESAR